MVFSRSYKLIDSPESRRRMIEYFNEIHHNFQNMEFYPEVSRLIDVLRFVFFMRGIYDTSQDFTVDQQTFDDALNNCLNAINHEPVEMVLREIIGKMLLFVLSDLSRFVSDHSNSISEYDAEKFRGMVSAINLSVRANYISNISLEDFGGQNYDLILQAEFQTYFDLLNNSIGQNVGNYNDDQQYPILVPFTKMIYLVNTLDDAIFI